jgi:hypothetical protein
MIPCFGRARRRLRAFCAWSESQRARGLRRRRSFRTAPGCPAARERETCDAQAGEVAVCAREGGVVIAARGLPPGAKVEIEVDVTYPHASLACRDRWTRVVRVDANGGVRAEIAPQGDRALHDEMRAWVRALPDGAELTSRVFVVQR